jgi:hypothetical protein
MKTTIDIAESLLSAARRAAADEDTTLRALVEEGLRRTLAEREVGSAPFRLRRASFGGDGLRPELAETGWDQLRDLSYEGRGA